jgi:hypothetical protein
MTGDQDDMLARLKSVLPPWFPTSTPVLDAVLTGFASVAASVYALLAYVTLQTRISTATDGFIDLISLDFFGRRFQRRPTEADPSYRARILKEVVRTRGTIASIKQVLLDLTGREPLIFEPPRPAAGGYGIACGYGLGGPVAPAYDISSAGAYGSPSYPAQVFITAYRPIITYGVPNVNGYNGYLGGYGVGAIEYVAMPGEAEGVIDDAAILAAVESVRAAGVVCWVNIQS